MGDQELSQDDLLAEREKILQQLREIGADEGSSVRLEEEDNVEAEPQPEEDSKSSVPREPVSTPEEDEEDDDEEEEDGNETEKPNKSSRGPPVAMTKIVVDRMDNDKSVPLPHGWTVITHESGMILYFHKFSRVVSHSRPYHVECAVRDHKIPVNAIPCLYRKIMDRKHRELDSQFKSEVPEVKQEEPPLSPCPYKQHDSLSPEEFRKHCEKRFKFKELTVMRYPNVKERGDAKQERRANALLKKSGFELDYSQLKKINDPGEVVLSSASGSILIDMTPLDPNKRNAPKKPFLLNPMGKTTVAVLNEFVQRLVKGSLVYEAEDNRSVTHPYKATAVLTMKRDGLREVSNCRESLTVLCEIAKLNEDRSAPGVNEETAKFPIGKGVGPNKKTSRLAAAKDALSKLLPKLRVTDDFICEGLIDEAAKKDFERESKELFKKLPIDAQNLVQLCTQFAIPKPYTLLVNAARRSMRWDGEELQSSKEVVGNGKCKVVLELAGMIEEATATGMKQAQQNAAQLLFKKMHPELSTYGSFLELYGRLEDKDRLGTAKKHHDEVVRLPDTGNLLRPNHIVIGKLCEEMSNVLKVTPARQFLFGTVPSEPMGVRKKHFTCQFPAEVVVESPAPFYPPPFASYRGGPPPFMPPPHHNPHHNPQHNPHGPPPGGSYHHNPHGNQRKRPRHDDHSPGPSQRPMHRYPPH